MIKMPIEEIVLKIKERTGLDDNIILSKINAKIEELSGLVSKEGAAFIVANEFGVKLFQPTSSGRLQIKNILPGLKNVSFMGRVLNISPVREFKSEKREGKVCSLQVGDESGQIRIVFWDVNHIKLVEDGTIKIGDIVKVKQGYVRESKVSDGVEVHTSSYSAIEVNPDDEDTKKMPEVKNTEVKSSRVNIVDATEGSFSEIRGAVVEIFESNPFFDVCPQCGKRARDLECVTHGKVVPKKSLFVSSIFDDGTSNIRVILFGDRAEKVIGMSSDEALLINEQNGNPSAPILHAKKKMLGKEFIISGRINKNAFNGNLEMVASRVSVPNYSDEARRLL